MSSRISSTMNLGQRAMANSQSALHTTAHNVANRTTEGYSRQRVEIASAAPYGMGKNRIGNGSRMISVQRVNNPYVERQLGSEKSQLGFLQGQASGLMRLEQVYNEQETEGLNTSMANFFNAYRELSTSPESMAKRIAVKETGDLLARDFNKVNEQLRGIRSDANSHVALTVNEINATTKEIATLNGQIQKIEAGGAGFANDERDRRDLLLKKLGELTEIRWAEGEDHTLTISAAGNAILVAGTDAQRLEVVASPASGTKADGDYDILYYHHEHAKPMVITDRIKGGRLGGILSVRDGDVYEFKNKMDAMAFEVSRSVNDAHQQGYNTYNSNGEAFFEPIALENASEHMRLRPEIRGDVGLIAAGLAPDSPGDNRVAHMVADIQHSKGLFDGNTSLTDFYKGIVTELGLRTQNINRSVETQEGIVKQLENIRESYSGVSIDEEMASMIEWQKQFDASARIIRTADEMMDTVLNIKRY